MVTRDGAEDAHLLELCINRPSVLCFFGDAALVLLPTYTYLGTRYIKAGLYVCGQSPTQSSPQPSSQHCRTASRRHRETSRADVRGGTAVVGALYVELSYR